MLFFIINQSLLWMDVRQTGFPGYANKILIYNDTIFSIGSTQTDTSGYDIYATAYTINGNSIWTYRLNGVNDSQDMPNDAIIGLDGNIYITGILGIMDTIRMNIIGVDYDLFVLKLYRILGSKLWIWTYGSSNNLPSGVLDGGIVIISDNNGNLYVGGYSDTTINNNLSSKHIILSLTQSGNLRWIYKNYIGSGGYYEGINSLAYVNNTIYGTFSTSNSTILSLNSNNGSLKWYNSNYTPNDHIIYDNGYLYVAGAKWFSGVPKLTIDKIDTTNGNIIWETIISDSIGGNYGKITKGNDGYIYVIGCVWYNNTPQHIISKIDPQTGSKIWLSNYSLGSSSCFPSTYIIYGNNSLYFGSSKSDSLAIYRIKPLDGSLMWKWTYKQGSFNRVNSILYVNSSPPKICGSGVVNNSFATFCIEDNATSTSESKELIFKNNKIIIKLQGFMTKNFSVNLYSVDGKKIPTNYEIKDNSIILNKPDRKGIYIIRIKSESKIYNYKIVI